MSYDKEKFDRFMEDIKKAIESLRENLTQEAFLIYHDDADGITSAAILKESLKNIGLGVRMICLEKLYPQVVQDLHAKGGRIFFYVDIAAAHAEFLSKINKSHNLTIILDHHDAVPSKDPLIYNLDPELYGFSGERDASGATTTYLFAKCLDQSNAKLAHLAVIGSAEIPGNLSGLNKIPLSDAIKQGKVVVSKRGEKELYSVRLNGGTFSHTDLSKKLTILGSVGYYKGGPEIAVRACLHGITPETLDKIKELESKRKQVNKRLLSKLRIKGLKEIGHIQYFHAEDEFKGMGVKVIGTFCSYLSYQKWIKQDKYLVGFMNMQPQIPGYGELRGNFVKVSVRVPQLLKQKIERNEAVPVNVILIEACKKLSGFADGHTVAASGVVPKGTELKLINEMNKEITKRKNTGRKGTLEFFLKTM